MVDPLPHFAANVRRLRKEKSLTQDALAQAALMDPAEIRRIESGRRDPGVRVLCRVAAGLGVDPVDLLAGVLGPEAKREVLSVDVSSAAIEH